MVQQIDRHAAVVVAGHTHGGQIALPGIADWAVEGPWISGRYWEGDDDLYVTSGVGTSILPVRLNAPPEVVILELSEKP